MDSAIKEESKFFRRLRSYRWRISPGKPTGWRGGIEEGGILPV